MKYAGKIQLCWREIDWKWRIIGAASVAAVAVVFIVLLIMLRIDHSYGRRHAIRMGDVLNLWMADLSAGALAAGSPGSPDMARIMKGAAVDDAALFGADGRIVAPLSHYGRRVKEGKILDGVLKGEKNVRSMDGGSRTEIFAPVINDKDGGAGEVVGGSYLSLVNGPSGIAGYAVAITIVTAGLLGLFAWYVVADTKRSLAPKAPAKIRFDDFERRLNDAVHRGKRDAISELESEWRKLLHVIGEPVIVLDKECRLIEANESALLHFRAGEISEGRHIIDFLNGNGCAAGIIDMLGRMEGKTGCIMRSDAGGYSISIYASCSNETRFKYTIACSKGVFHESKSIGDGRGPSLRHGA